MVWKLLDFFDRIDPEPLKSEPIQNLISIVFFSFLLKIGYSFTQQSFWPCWALSIDTLRPNVVLDGLKVIQINHIIGILDLKASQKGCSKGKILLIDKIFQKHTEYIKNQEIWCKKGLIGVTLRGLLPEIKF